jgi:phage tail-like protein
MMAQTGQRVDPYGSFDFLVEIDGITRASFQEASGLDSAIDITEYREGGDNQTSRKLPGKTKFSNITLKRGVTDDRELWDWHQLWVKGDPKAKRINGSIVLLDRQGQEKARWNFVNAWPAKWTGPSLNAKSSDVAIETLELAHEGLERA